MVDLDRHRILWTGFLGAPGISTFYVPTGVPANIHLADFVHALIPHLPSDVTMLVEPSGDTIDSATGGLVGAWSDAATPPETGTNTQTYSAVTGALIQWGCSTFLSGRRLRGHTFLVPFGGDQYDVSGQVSSSAVAAVTAAAAALISTLGSSLTIWQRPRVAAPAYTDRSGHAHPAITARSGGYGPVLTGLCRPVVTELRSRRD